MEGDVVVLIVSTILTFILIIDDIIKIKGGISFPGLHYLKERNVGDQQFEPPREWMPPLCDYLFYWRHNKF